MSPRPVPVLLGALALGWALAACGHEDDGKHVTLPPDAPARYVAMGDSYTSGPAIPRVVDEGCARSNRNYPSLVADELDLTLTDVSCGGATTLSLTGPQRTLTGEAAPPQLDALSPATELVTIGIGFNEDNLFGTLLGTCVDLARSDAEGAPCRQAMNSTGQDQLMGVIRRIEGRVADSLEDLKQRAPGARVVLVGYPQLVPDDDRCDELPLAAGDYPYVRRVVDMLGRATERAAAAAGAEYVDLLAPSDGHDVCAGEDAWISPVTVEGDAAPMHPLAQGQAAVAEILVDALTGS